MKTILYININSDYFHSYCGPGTKLNKDTRINLLDQYYKTKNIANASSTSLIDGHKGDHILANRAKA